MFFTSLSVIALSLSTSFNTDPKSFLGCPPSTGPQSAFAPPTAACLTSVKAPITVEVNYFTDTSAQRFAAEMAAAQQTGQAIIPIVIDSFGGEIYALLRMVSIIQSSKVPVATIVEGKAMSCGAVLFMMGAEGYRFAGQQATILIHDASSAGEGKVEDLKVSMEETERLNRTIMTLMAKNTGHPDDFFMKLLKERGHTDWFISIDEAKKMNIVNKIGVPELKVKIETKYTLE